MTPELAAALPPVAACLHGGGIAVLFVPVGGGGVVAARDAVRATCSDVLAALAARHGLRPHASRSATPGLGALALSASAGVGVDVERLRPELLDDDLLALALHADERRLHAAADDASRDPHAAARRFFAAWTRKEAVMKALGLGLALAPASFSAGPPLEALPTTVDWHPLHTTGGASRVCSLAVPHLAGDGAFAAALAVSADRGTADIVVRTLRPAPADVRVLSESGAGR